jgi:hypothetical protein
VTEGVSIAQSAAEVLAPDLVKMGARRLGREILCTPAERGMQRVYARAIAGLLVEVAETGQAQQATHGGPDPEAMKVAETVLGALCSDGEAAGLLLNVALRPGPVPVEALRERAVALGHATDTLPFVFDGAMWVLAEKVWEEFLAEASKENSQIQALVNAELLTMIRDHHQSLRAASSEEHGSLLPPPPGLVLGRAEELDRAKQALGVASEGGVTEPGPASPPRRVIAVHG